MTQMVEIPDGYSELLAAVKADVVAIRLRAARTANNDMLGLYFLRTTRRSASSPQRTQSGSRDVS